MVLAAACCGLFSNIEKYVRSVMDFSSLPIGTRCIDNTNIEWVYAGRDGDGYVFNRNAGVYGIAVLVVGSDGFGLECTSLRIEHVIL